MTRRQEPYRFDAHRGEQPDELIFHDVGQGADDQQFGGVGRWHAPGPATPGKYPRPRVKVVSIPLPE